MIITEIRKRRGTLYLLVLDGEPAMTVDARTFDESPYRPGGVIDDGQLRELLEQSARRRAREKALYLLSLRDHSRAELEDKLRRGEGRELRLRKRYPLRRTVQELTARGGDREIALQAAGEPETDDAALALELLRKKYYNRLQTEEDRRRVRAALARRGFGGGDIRRAMEAFGEENGGWTDGPPEENEMGEITEEWP